MGSVSCPAAAAEAARDAAMQRAEDGANPVWAQAAYWAVRLLAYRQPAFCTDEVWWLLDELGVETPEPRAMGPVMRKAFVEGVIDTTDQWQRSLRPQCHCRPVMRWRSCLYGQPLPADFLSQQP